METVRLTVPLSCLLAVLSGTFTALAQTADDARAPSEACIACRAEVDSIRGVLSEREWAAVQGGEIVTSKVDSKDADGHKKSLVQSSAILSFSAAEVWSVVIDFESRPKFVPGAKEVKTIRREGNQLWLQEHLRVFLMNIRFGVINTLEPELGRVTWRIDPEAKNDIADTSGSWQIVSLDEQRTLVHYEARIDSGKPVPGFIEDFLARRSLPKMISGLRDEVARRFPQLRDAGS